MPRVEVERMNRYFSMGIATLALLTFTAGLAQAQAQGAEETGTKQAAVTVTPFVSLGSFVSSRVGAAIAFPVTDSVSLEAEIGYRRQEMSALSAHLSVLQD